MFLSDPHDPVNPTFAAAGDGRSIGERLADFGTDFVELASDPKKWEAREAAFGDLVSAAAGETMYARVVSARAEAYAEAADRRIAAVHHATGVQLENPYRRGYQVEARRLVRDAAINDPNYDPRGGIPQQAIGIFNERLAQVRRDNADKLAGMDLDIPIEAIANNIATGAEQRAGIARANFEATGGGAVGGFLADVLGGLGGASRDPLTLWSMAFGPTVAAGKTVAARVLSGGAAQGLFNIGVAQAEKPATNAWRAERGQDPGSSVLSMHEVGFAFAFGFIPGAVIQGAVEAAGHRAVARVLANEAGHGDTAAALDYLGAGSDTELARTVEAMQRSRTADAAAVADRPEGATGILHEDAALQAARHAGDPVNEPPPALVPAIARDVTDEAADTALRAAPDGFTAIDTLRGDRALVESALSSPREDLRAAGRLATLSDDAWAMVRDGGATPDLGLVVAEHVGRTEWQGPILAELARRRPESLGAARLLAADLAEGEAARLALTRAKLEDQMATEPSPPVRETAPADSGVAGGVEKTHQASPEAGATADGKAGGDLIRAAIADLKPFEARWIEVPEGKIYLRRSEHPGIGETIDIPSVEFDDAARGQGAFRRYLGLVESEAAARGIGAVYVEQVMNPRLADFLRRRGYRQETPLTGADPGMSSAAAGLLAGVRSETPSFYRNVTDDRMFVAEYPLRLSTGQELTGDVERIALDALAGDGRHSTATRELRGLIGILTRNGADTPQQASRIANLESAIGVVNRWRKDDVTVAGRLMTEEERFALPSPTVGDPPAGGTPRGNPDPIDMVPVTRDDGSAVLVTREAALASAGEREGLVADLVRSCKS